MPEPLNIGSIWLRIDNNNNVTLDIQVGDQWRRVIRAYHAGYTSHCVSRLGLEIGDETTDVTAQYQESQEGDE